MPPPPPPPPIVCDGDLFLYAEVMPAAPGCADYPTEQERGDCTREKLMTFVRDNLTWPGPMWCGEGTAVVQFVIGKDGRMAGEKIVRSIDNESDRVVRNILERMKEEMPVWSPGKQRGRPVPVMYNMPVRFKLE